MSGIKRPVFAGNWKLFGSLAESRALAAGVREGTASVKDCDIVVAPSFTALGAVIETLAGSNIGVAGQDCHWETKGAFTGEVAASQLKDAGCRYVILGHSERRQYFGESDEWVNKKTKAALAAGLLPIVCVGETLAERDANQTLDRVAAQLEAGLKDLSDGDLAKVLLAYEPVWAIGTGRTATPAQAEEVHRFIRTRLQARTPAQASSLPLLYGGSVKPDNIASLMTEPNVDGALVGGASLTVESFVRIVREGTESWSRS